MSQASLANTVPTLAVAARRRDAIDLPSINDETSLFWRVRIQMLRNAWNCAVRTSRLRMLMIALLTALLWAVLFALFADGFQFLSSSITDRAIHDETIRAAYSLFFASLIVLLIFSTGIILYSGLYCSADVRFLLTGPVRPQRVFLHKFQEAMFYSSWVFLLLCTPMLVAYGLVEAAGWCYFVMLIPFLLAFAFIPSLLGATFCMIVVWRLPANRGQFLAIAAVMVVVAAVLIGWSVSSELQSNLLTPGWFEEVLERLRVTEYRLLPSWWLSSGLLEATHANWSDDAGRRALSESTMFLTLLIANAMFLHLVAIWTSQAIFRRGYLTLQSEQFSRRPRNLGWLDRLLTSTTGLLGPELSLLVLKDVRLFRRDPLQWSQFLIFFMLLLMYFMNMHRVSANVAYAGWVNMISFLNLAVVGLILSTFTTRFVYPAISLEGRRFWILGLLPVRRDTILWSKFLFSALGTALPCGLLILLSDVMLGVSHVILGVHLVVCAMLCLGLSGIAVGLGAKMPNLREESPARIAAGFGGTMTLVVSSAYIIAIVVLSAVPCHFYLVLRDASTARTLMATMNFRIWLAAGGAGALLVAIAATVVPMRMGLRAFRDLEF